MVSACGFGVCECCRSSGGGCGACAWGGIWGENDFFLLSEPPLRPLFPPNPDICCSVRGRFDAAQKEVGAWCFFLPRTSRPLPCPMPASLSNVLIPCPKYLFTLPLSQHPTPHPAPRESYVHSLNCSLEQCGSYLSVRTFHVRPRLDTGPPVTCVCVAGCSEPMAGGRWGEGRRTGDA